METIIELSPNDAEVTPRLIHGKPSLLLSPFQEKTSESILQSPDNEVKWNGRTYGYRLLEQGRGSTGFWYQFEIFERRTQP